MRGMGGIERISAIEMALLILYGSGLLGAGVQPRTYYLLFEVSFSRQRLVVFYTGFYVRFSL